MSEDMRGRIACYGLGFLVFGCFLIGATLKSVNVGIGIFFAAIGLLTLIMLVVEKNDKEQGK